MEYVALDNLINLTSHTLSDGVNTGITTYLRRFDNLPEDQPLKHAELVATVWSGSVQ